MSTFTLTREDSQYLNLVEKTVDTSGLIRSTFFKNIKEASQKVADALELQWGHSEFLDYIAKIINEIDTPEFSMITDALLKQLLRIGELHIRLFPEIKMTVKAKAKYKWDDINFDTKVKRW